MFSGLISHIGLVREFSGEKITIQSDLTPKIGASIAINGICTTVTNATNGAFSAILSKETRDCVALENLRGRVHLEEALRINDRLDGHIVQGHIDSIGVIREISRSENGFNVFIAFDLAIYPLLIPKGSVAIDGVSLTINAVSAGEMRLTIIPHTFQNTLFCEYSANRRVNIETDMLNRSLLHLMKTREFWGESRESLNDSRRESYKSWREIDSILLHY